MTTLAGNNKLRSSWGYIRKRNVRYHAYYTAPDGRRISAGSFDTKNEAARYLARIKFSIDINQWNAPPSVAQRKLERISLVEYAERAIETRPVRETTKDKYRTLLNLHVRPYFEDRLLKDITKQDCADWRLSLSNAHPVAKERATTFLKLVFNKAVTEDEILDKNPARHLKVSKGKMTKSAILDSLLERDDVLALIEATSPRYRLITALGAYCGTRISEALALQRQDIDLRKNTVYVNKQVSHSRGDVKFSAPKTVNSVRRIPIPQEARHYFTDHLALYTADAPDSYLFPRTIDKFPVSRGYYNDHIFDPARRAIKRPRFRYHDLRHTCLTHYARQGATIRDLMAIAGHSQAEVAILYQETSSDRLQELAQRFGYTFERGNS